LFSGQEGFAQTSKADSLIALLEGMQREDRVDFLVEIAENFYPVQLENANKYGQEALELAKELDDQRGIAGAYFILAKTTGRFNNEDQALEYYFQAIENYRILDEFDIGSFQLVRHKI